MAKKQYVICISNTDYTASLELRKIYEVIPDAKASKIDHLRIIAESGEDYLYPSSRFIEISLPKTIRDALSNAA